MFKSDRILTLDIGAHGLKLAEFVTLKSGGLELVHYAVGSLGLDPQSDTDRSQYIITTIHELLRESGAHPGPVLLSVAGQSVFSRFVKLPPVDQEKVFQIIQYEAQQNVPFPISEVVWDYQLISGAEGEVDVMLAAIKADIIQNLTDCVQFAGLQPDLVDVAPMSLYNAVRYNYDNLPPCTLIIDVGARSTDLIFIEANRVFSRSVPVAGNAITQQIMNEFSLSFDDAEEMKKAHAYVAFGGAYEAAKSETVDKVSKSVRSVMTKLHAEINRSINFYRSQQAGQAPSLILLTGGTSVIPYTDTFLKEKLRMEVDYFNPFQNVAVSDAIPAEQIGRQAHMMGQLVGLALRRLHSCPIEINLMPSNVLEEKAFRKKFPAFLVSAVVLILALSVWAAFFFRMAALNRVQQQQVQARVTQLESVERQLHAEEVQADEVAGKIDKLIGVTQKRGVWLNMLAAVNKCLPDGMWLTSIKPVYLLPGEQPPATTDGRQETPDPAAALNQPLKGLMLEGAGYRDKIPSSEAIGKFRDQLRLLPQFSEQTEIVWQPQMRAEDYALEFRILAVLKKPQEL